jgi:hypothetical protein
MDDLSLAEAVQLIAGRLGADSGRDPKEELRSQTHYGAARGERQPA